MIKTLAALSLLAAAVLACAPAPSSPAATSTASAPAARESPVDPTLVEPLPTGGVADIEGVEWVATSVVGITPDHAVAPTILFEDGRVGGFAGCNHYGADVTVGGGRIDVGEEMTITLRLCDGPVGDLESAFLQALGEAQTIVIVEGELIIDGPAGELRFARGFSG